METVLKKLAEKYLSVFLKDYRSKRKELDIAVLKGTITLPSVDLNERVLQSLLGIRYLEIKKVVSGALELKIPWSKLQEKPVQIALKNLHIYVEEPDELLVLDPLPKILQSKDSDGKKKGKKSKRHWFDAAWENLQLSVDELYIELRSCGRPDSGSRPAPLSIHLKGIDVRSVNKEWEQIDDMTELVAEKKKTGVLHIHKLITLQEFSCSIGEPVRIDVKTGQVLPPVAVSRAGVIVKGDEEKELMEFFNLGDESDETCKALRVELDFKRHAHKGTITYLKSAVQLGDINIDWMRDVYCNLMEAVEGLMWCTSREKLLQLAELAEDGGMLSPAVQRLQNDARDRGFSLLSPRYADRNADEVMAEWDQGTKKLMEEFERLEEQAEEESSSSEGADAAALLTDHPLADVMFNIRLDTVRVQLKERDYESELAAADAKKSSAAAAAASASAGAVASPSHSTAGRRKKGRASMGKFKVHQILMNDIAFVVGSTKNEASNDEAFARYIKMNLHVGNLMLIDLWSGHPMVVQDGDRLLKFDSEVYFTAGAALGTLDKLDVAVTTCPLKINWERNALQRFVSFVSSRTLVLPPGAPRKAIELDLTEPSQLSIRVRFGEIFLLIPAPEKTAHTHDVRVVFGPVSWENLPLGRSGPHGEPEEVLRFKGSSSFSAVAIPVRHEYAALQPRDVEVELVKPLDAQVVIEWKRYIATIRRIAALQVPKGKIFPTNQRVEVSVIVTNVDIELSEPILASLLQGNAEVMKIFDSWAADASKRDKMTRRKSEIKMRIQQKVKGESGKRRKGKKKKSSSASQTPSRAITHTPTASTDETTTASTTVDPAESSTTGARYVGVRADNSGSIRANSGGAIRSGSAPKTLSVDVVRPWSSGSAVKNASTAAVENTRQLSGSPVEGSPILSRSQRRRSRSFSAHTLAQQQAMMAGSEKFKPLRVLGTHEEGEQPNSTSTPLKKAVSTATSKRSKAIVVPSLDLTPASADGTASCDDGESNVTGGRGAEGESSSRTSYEAGGAVGVISTLALPLYMRMSINPGTEGFLRLRCTPRERERSSVEGFRGGFNLLNMCEKRSLRDWAEDEKEARLEAGIEVNFQSIDVMVEHRTHQQLKATINLVQLSTTVTHHLLLMPFSVQLRPISESIGEGLVEGTHGLETVYEFLGKRPKLISDNKEDEEEQWHPHRVHLRLVGTMIELTEHGQLSGPPMQAFNSMLNDFMVRSGFSSSVPTTTSATAAHADSPSLKTVTVVDPSTTPALSTLGSGVLMATTVQCEIGDSQFSIIRCQETEGSATTRALSQWIGSDFFQLHFAKADRRIMAEQIRQFERRLHKTEKRKKDMEAELTQKVDSLSGELKQTMEQLILAKLSLAEVQEEATKLQKKLHDQAKERDELESKVKAVTSTYNAVLALIPKSGGQRFKARRQIGGAKAPQIPPSMLAARAALAAATPKKPGEADNASGGGGAGSKDSSPALKSSKSGSLGIVAAANSTATAAEAEAQEAEVTLQMLADDKVRLEEEVFSSNAKCTELENYIERLQEQLKQIKADSEVKKLSDKVIDLEKTVRVLEIDNEKLIHDNDNLNDLLNTREDTIEALRQQLADAEEEMDLLRARGGGGKKGRRGLLVRKASNRQPPPDPAQGVPSELAGGDSGEAIGRPRRDSGRDISQRDSPGSLSTSGRRARAASNDSAVNRSPPEPKEITVTGNPTRVIVKEKSFERLKGTMRSFSSRIVHHNSTPSSSAGKKDNPMRAESDSVSPSPKNRFKMAGKGILAMSRLKNIGHKKSVSEHQGPPITESGHLGVPDTDSARGSRLSRMKNKVKSVGRKKKSLDVPGALDAGGYRAPPTRLSRRGSNSGQDVSSESEELSGSEPQRSIPVDSTSSSSSSSSSNSSDSADDEDVEVPDEAERKKSRGKRLWNKMRRKGDDSASKRKFPIAGSRPLSQSARASPASRLSARSSKVASRGGSAMYKRSEVTSALAQSSLTANSARKSNLAISGGDQADDHDSTESSDHVSDDDMARKSPRSFSQGGESDDSSSSKARGDDAKAAATSAVVTSKPALLSSVGENGSPASGGTEGNDDSDDSNEIERLLAHAEMMKPAPDSLVPTSSPRNADVDEALRVLSPPSAPSRNSSFGSKEEEEEVNMDKFIVTPSTVQVGAKIELLYTLSSFKHHKYDWFGLYNRLETNPKKYESYSWKKSLAGKTTFRAPKTPGVYEVRVFRGGAKSTYYDAVRVSNPIVVTNAH